MGEIVYEFYFGQAVMKIVREGEKKKITAPTVTKDAQPAFCSSLSFWCELQSCTVSALMAALSLLFLISSRHSYLIMVP